MKLLTLIVFLVSDDNIPFTTHREPQIGRFLRIFGFIFSVSVILEHRFFINSLNGINVLCLLAHFCSSAYTVAEYINIDRYSSYSISSFLLA